MNFILAKFGGTVTEFVEMCHGTTNPLYFKLNSEAPYFWRVDNGPEQVPYIMQGSLFADNKASVYIGGLTWWCAVCDTDRALNCLKRKIDSIPEGRQRSLMRKFELHKQSSASEDELSALVFIKKAMKQQGML